MENLLDDLVRLNLRLEQFGREFYAAGGAHLNYRELINGVVDA